MNVSSLSTVRTVAVSVTNIGTRTGADVVQLYLGDTIASIVRFKQQLKGFHKVFLRPQEQKRVALTLRVPDLAFYNKKMQLVVEAGQFDVWIGADCTTPQPADCISGSFEVTQDFVISS